MIRDALLADTARRLDDVNPAAVVPHEAMRRAAWRAAAAVVLLAGTGAVLSAPAARAARASWLYLSPGGFAFRVSPGNVRVRPGTPLVVSVDAPPSIGTLVPEVEARIGEASRRERMTAAEPGRFTFTFPTVPSSFKYHVQVASRRSPEFQVTLLEPPRVSRIDLTYDFPAFTHLPARSEEDGGDVYAPEGTRVHMVVRPAVTTAPVASAALALRSGRQVPLTIAADGSVSGDLVVSADDGYRVQLTDTDGLQNADEPEYFVRMLDDRPPEVRIVRPAGDRQVTPLEEVEIEARADDDHGVDQLELVYGVRGKAEKAVPLGGDGRSLSVTGRHTIYLEDLGVSPGDFVTFYARARDIGRGKRPSEARSDIFFLEVTPFADEFAMAQSQAMAGGGRSMDDLVRLQKDVIIGTWKLDRRATGSGAAASPADVKALGKAQGIVRRRTEMAAQREQMAGAVLRQPGTSADEEDQTPLAAAARAMGRAQSALDGGRIGPALPSEMEALNHLLKAESEAQRKEIARQQAGAGGGYNRAQQDLSTLFDRELQRQQQTNYETPKTAQEQREDSNDDTLDRVRDLARRQEALQRQQDDLARDRAKMDPEEVRRRLEHLTREQSDLRRQAELMAQQMQQAERRSGQQQPSGQSGASGQSQQSGRSGGSAAGRQADAMRQAAGDMRNAASNLRREDPDSARGQSRRALDRLHGVEQAMRDAGPEERRRALGDAQLEARQLAARQRQVGDRAAEDARGNADARRRLSSEQQQLAERAGKLGARLRQLAGAAQERDEQQRLAAAASELDDNHLAGRMRELARALGAGGTKAQPDAGSDLARSLDRVAEQVAGPAGADDKEGRQLGDDLARTRELRERLADLERQIAESGKGTTSASAGRAGSGTPSAGGSPDAKAEAARLGELRRQYLETLSRARDANPQLRESMAGTGGAGSTPVGQGMVTSAPGTEAFKQDFARWEALHRDITLGLERLEASLSQRVIERASRDRLPSGNADATPPEYAGSVDRYFKALAEEPR